MRLIRLRVRNIASLKGEHEIDFSDIQKESPLFAITGETGSGKSSILNAIGLALYGQVYKKNLNQIDVVTLGEKDGSIELIFQVKGKYYLAEWRARVLKQNGQPYSTPQAPVRHLYTIEGANFNAQKTITEINASELLNLDFDQFCKCIILNQGEFARFLTSSFTERKEILEKLYPGEVLESMGKELRLEIDSLEKDKNEIEIKLSELRGDGTSGDVLKEQKKSLEKELSELESTLKISEELERNFTSLLNYFDKYLENERRKDAIKNELKNETSKYNLILKKGEEIQERYQNLKNDQELKLPGLQEFLKKEEALKHLESSFEQNKIKSSELEKKTNDLHKKLLIVEEEEKKQQDKFTVSLKSLTHPLETLKNHKDHFESLFEVFSEKESLEKDIKGKAEYLSHIELTGKELKLKTDITQSELKLIPEDILNREKEGLRKKTELGKLTDERQRLHIKVEELTKNIEKLLNDIKTYQEKRSTLREVIQRKTDEILPLETSLHLQEMLNASQICVDHASKLNHDTCPVCEAPVANSKWQELKEKLSRTDLKNIRERFETESKLLFEARQEEELLSTKIISEEENLQKKKEELKLLQNELKSPLPSLEELDKELEDIRKKLWNKEKLEKEFTIQSTELQKVREQYAKLKAELGKVESLFNEKTHKLEEVAALFSDFIPIINPEVIRDLKLEVKNFLLCTDSEVQLERIRQEKTYLLEQKAQIAKDTTLLTHTLSSQKDEIEERKKELSEKLGGEKASVLIEKMNLAVRQVEQEWKAQNDEQNKQEQALKSSQGRLYTHDELAKDFDIHYRNELVQVKNTASKHTNPQLQKLKDLNLDFTSPRELFLPVKELIETEKDQFKKLTNECRMNFASVSTKLSEWEKLQDKIQLLELKEKEITQDYQRKMRLFEVLGKDELRTFVLSLVEENLIHQTNEELQKLCQGRYEIIHQTKSMRMTPEFFILDKFREGGRRKVSTLSGGETFMVSLAMALGLAEMTRGQAEIDSLFIDEGFGTLDQDSLEDVLDMLQQIQTRGLMVGIISHIKTLTSAIPVNLHLNKKQDGASTVTVIRN